MRIAQHKHTKIPGSIVAMIIKEKLKFFSLNNRRSKQYILCDYCKRVSTKGRDFMDFGCCENCYVAEYIEKKSQQKQSP